MKQWILRFDGKHPNPIKPQQFKKESLINLFDKNTKVVNIGTKTWTTMSTTTKIQSPFCLIGFTRVL